MINPKLFMVMLGCTPPGRNTEQHDIFFGIGDKIKDLIPSMIAFWPEANGVMHVDAWREVNFVDGYTIDVVSQDNVLPLQNSVSPKLFFLNLGGYKPNEFDEFHYKMLAVSESQAGAIKQAKQTTFYKHTGFTGASSHVDDKFGLDVDDLHNVMDILPQEFKQKFRLELTADSSGQEDELHLGYFKLTNL